jgi:PAS domain S-box-containing protein
MLVFLGSVFSLLHIMHIMDDIQEAMGVEALITGAVLPLVLSLVTVGAGYWLYKRDLPAQQLQRIAVWFILGIGGVLSLAMASVIYEIFEGAQLSHIDYFLLNYATAGGTIGILVGWYDAQTQLHAERLRVFQKAVEHSGHSISITDTDGSIEYVNPQFEEQTGFDREEVMGEQPSILRSEAHEDEFYARMWETITDGEVWAGEVTNEMKTGEDYVINQTIAPVTDATGKIERFVAINADISEQKRRQRELERQRDKLDQLNQFMSSMWDVSKELVEASNESELETDVCAALEAGGFCEAAWFAEYESRTETLTPSVAAGVDVEALETGSVDDGADGEAASLYRTAVRDREVATLEAEGEWEVLTRDGAECPETETYVTIPVVRDNLIYGTLTMVLNRSTAFVENEREQFEALGDAIGHGLETIKTRALLHADRIVEVELQSRDENDLLVAAANRSDGTVSIDGAVPLSEERALLYVRIAGGSAEDLRETVTDMAGVEMKQVVSEGPDEAVVTVEVGSAGSLVKRAMELGVTVDRARATEGKLELVVHVLPGEDVRSIVEGLQTSFPDVSLTGKRERERQQELNRSTLDEMSQRQHTSLSAAYHAGYFESPRESTAEEVADSLGVSGPTFHKHLRRAERILLQEVLDPPLDDIPAEG